VSDAIVGRELTGELGPHVDDFLRLARLASAAFDDFAFRGGDLARRYYAELHRRGGAEFAPPAGRLLLVDGRPAGMFAVVPPDLLKRRRLIGAMMLVRWEELRAEPALVERIRAGAGTMLRPQATDAYLSRIAVDPAVAGRGVGRWLLARALAAGRELGLERCVLDVAASNARAIALYEAAGFERIGEGEAVDADTGARLRHLHLARAL